MNKELSKADIGIVQRCEGCARKTEMITESEIKQFCIENGGLRFKCKNCGYIYDGVNPQKNYCDKCKWWICDTCRLAGITECFECKSG